MERERQRERDRERERERECVMWISALHSYQQCLIVIAFKFPYLYPNHHSSKARYSITIFFYFHIFQTLFISYFGSYKE